MADPRLLVPVSDSETVRETVAYAVEQLLEAGGGHLRAVLVHPSRTDLEYRDPSPDPSIAAAATILDRIESWVGDDAGDAAESITVTTGHLGTDTYIFSPADVARYLRADVQQHSIDRVILDPEYDPRVGSPLMRPLAAELADINVSVTEAPVRRQRRSVPLLNRVTPLRAGFLFVVAFLFYQLLAGGIKTFDLVTGAIAGTIVAVALGRVSLSRDPTRSTPLRLLRFLIYLPYLLKEIIISNVRITAAILHPRLPIKPTVIRYRPAVWGAVPTTVLANSITLTPGTLTIRADAQTGDRSLLIHTLVPWAREGLLDGGLEHSVRYLFYGSAAGDIPDPRDRDATTVITADDTESETTDDGDAA